MNKETLPARRPDNQEIDMAEVARYIWQRRCFLLKMAGIGLVAGLIVAFSLPKEYVSEVKLTPENGEKPRSGQLGNLAAMAGIQVGSSASGSAMSVDLYPDIVASAPFLLELAGLTVTDRHGNETTCYDYLTKKQKEAWWRAVWKWPFHVIARMKGGSAPAAQQDAPASPGRPFVLTPEQESYLAVWRSRISVQTDKKNGTIQASVRMQDAYVAARLMETVVSRLQAYITDYRTKKAKQDLAFSEKLYKEAREAYYRAQTAYARYTDENNYTASVSSNVEKIRLRQEMDLAYDVFNQMARQRETAKIKVQEQTPVYTVIEPARVPLSPASPGKLLWMGGMALAFFAAGFCWLVVRNLMQGNKN